jgi:hypothetical protein
MKRQILILLAITCAACATRANSSSIAYRKQVVHSVPVHVIYVDLNNRDVKVTVALAKHGRGSSEPASSMIARTAPKAAITGTFFDTRSLLPTGDIVIDGIRAHAGCLGPALCVTPDNNARIIPHKLRDRQSTDYETVLAGGPTLLQDGRVAINARAEGFRDPALFRHALRTAVGLTASNKMLLVSVNRPISMRKLAYIMLDLGAKDAMMLDGGSSTAMYANGRFVSHPGRRLTNLLTVHKRPKDIKMASKQLDSIKFSPEKIREAINRLTAQADIFNEPWYRQPMLDLNYETPEPNRLPIPNRRGTIKTMYLTSAR